MNERIVELRKALGLTLKDFGAKIGMSISGLSEIEHGRSAVTDRVIKLIKAAFPQVSETWLKDGIGDMFLPIEPDEELELVLAQTNLPEVAKQCVRVYEKASPELKAHLDRYLKNLLRDIMSGYPEAAIPAPDSVPSAEELAAKAAENYRTSEATAEKKDVFRSLEHGT